VGGSKAPDALYSILRVPTPNSDSIQATLVFQQLLGGSNHLPRVVSGTPPMPTLVGGLTGSAASCRCEPTRSMRWSVTNAPGGFSRNYESTTTGTVFQIPAAVIATSRVFYFLWTIAVVFSLGNGVKRHIASICWLAPTTAPSPWTDRNSAWENFNDGTEKDITSLGLGLRCPRAFATNEHNESGTCDGNCCSVQPRSNRL